MSPPKNAPKSGKGLKLPAVKLPSMPSVKAPAIDGTVATAMLLVAGLSIGSSVLAVRFMMPAQVVVQRPAESEQEPGKAYNPKGFPDITTGPNVTSDFSLSMERPVIAQTAYVHPQASVIGYVTLMDRVYVGPQASIRGDEGKSLYIGADSNVQDGAVVHGLATEEKGHRKYENIVRVGGEEYAVYIGDRVTLSPQSQVFGPAVVSDGTYLGMQTLVFKSRIGNGCVLEPRAAAIGVSIPDGRYVPAGMVVTTQDQADKLPKIDATYGYKDAGAQEVKVHTQLAEGYQALSPSGKVAEHDPDAEAVAPDAADSQASGDAMAGDATTGDASSAGTSTGSSTESGSSEQ